MGETLIRVDGEPEAKDAYIYCNSVRVREFHTNAQFLRITHLIIAMFNLFRFITSLSIKLLEPCFAFRFAYTNKNCPAIAPQANRTNGVHLLVNL